MKRINNSDIRINILDMNLPEKFTFQFYTVDENVNINRTEEDVDSEGFINLDWSLLQLLGEGILSYILTKHTPDTSYPDGYYDVTITRSTNYYIVTDVEPIPPEQSGQTMDIIIGIIDEYSKYTDGLVSAETENRIEADNAISGSVSNLDDRVTALENIDRQYATKSDVQEGVEDSKAYTREYAYSKTDVDEKIATIDTTNYATKSELQNGVGDAEAYTREYAYSKTEVDGKIATIDTTNYATKAELHDGIDEAKVYTSDYAYSKTEVDGKIASIDTTNYATKTELQNGVDEAEAYTRDYAYNKAEVDGKIASIDTTTFATKEELNEISGQTISVIEGKGYLTEETEPAFNASAAKDITSQNITDWNNKSDFSGDYNDLINKPENVSAFNNDAGYLTEHQSLAGYYTSGQTDALLEGKQNAGDYATKSDVASAVNAASGATVDWVKGQNYLTEHQSLADYYTSGQTNALLDKKANISDIPDVSSYINNADYDSNDKKIKFYHGNTLITYIDATAFIKDGMVTDVTISNGYLVITFNTDSGQEPISIPLTDIFDPSNYYTSGQTENRLNEVSGATINWVKSQNYLTEHQSLANYYTSAQTDNLLAGKQNAGNYVSASTLNNYYTSGQTNTLLSGKQDVGDYATNSEVASAVNAASGATVNWVKSQNYLTEHQSLADYYTSGQTDSLLAGKQASGNYVSASTLNNYYTSGQTNTLLADKQDAASAVTGYEKPYVIRVMTQEQYNQITPDNDTIYIING